VNVVQRIRNSKALAIAPLAVWVIGTAVAVIAFTLENSLPYRIGPDIYTRYLWAGRLSIAAFLIPLLAIALSIASRQRLPIILGACSIVFLIGLMPGSIHSGPNPAAWCYNNLRKTDSAKYELVQQRNLTNGTVITAEALSPLIAGGLQKLKCYEGGVYITGLGIYDT